MRWKYLITLTQRLVHSACNRGVVGPIPTRVNYFSSISIISRTTLQQSKKGAICCAWLAFDVLTITKQYTYILADVCLHILGSVPLELLSLRWRHNGRDDVSNHQPHDCLLNRLFRHRWKKTSKLRVTGLCAGNSAGTGEFPTQKASYAENVSIWWRHHVTILPVTSQWLLGPLTGILLVKK